MTKKRKVVAIIQARMGSTRLPGKMMMPLSGKPILWHVIERAKKLKTVDEIILATTDKKRDGVLAKVAKKSGIKVFRGSEDDVLARFVGAATAAKADVILRINADCPLFDIETSDKVVRELIKQKMDVVFAYSKRPSAVGGFEAVTLDALNRVAAVTTNPYDQFAHEHVTVYLGLNPKYYPATKKFAKRILLAPDKKFVIKGMRIAVDTREDYDFMHGLYKSLYKKGEIIPLTSAVSFLKKHKELLY